MLAVYTEGLGQKKIAAEVVVRDWPIWLNCIYQHCIAYDYAPMTEPKM